MNDHILTLIAAYTNNEISEKQFGDLQEWLQKSPDNIEIFSAYLKFYKKSRGIGFSESINSEKAWEEILTKLKNPLIKIPSENIVKKRFINKPWVKYVSLTCIVVITITAIFFNQQHNNQPIILEPVIVNNTIEVGSDKAKLTLEDGVEIILEKGNNYKTEKVKSNGEEIVYQPKVKESSVEKQTIAYNYLTIPRGGQFQITLSDNTKIWLNSESQLKYPVTFINGESRQVELIYGEAYFDVSPSSENNGTDFKVIHNAQEIQVLGTEFNVKAYSDETNIYTTLIEGVVAIYADNVNETLKPNEQANIDTLTNAISIYNVDVNDEVAWKNGVFSFDRKSLKNIVKVISRWYDVDVVFSNKDLESEKFIGKINKSSKIEDILSVFKSTGKIKNFEINNKKVILK